MLQKEVLLEPEEKDLLLGGSFSFKDLGLEVKWQAFGGRKASIGKWVVSVNVVSLGVSNEVVVVAGKGSGHLEERGRL